jgi:hypothetical protein
LARRPTDPLDDTVEFTASRSQKTAAQLGRGRSKRGAPVLRDSPLRDALGISGGDSAMRADAMSGLSAVSVLYVPLHFTRILLTV